MSCCEDTKNTIEQDKVDSDLLEEIKEYPQGTTSGIPAEENLDVDIEGWKDV